MRDVLDCGILLVPDHEEAMRDWVALHQSRLTRIRLHMVPLDTGRPLAAAALPAGGTHSQDVHVLARLAVSLKRYDSCILPVAPSSVAWARMALQEAGAKLTTPILLLIHGMTAPAIEDLLDLGAADFLAQPACLESMRVRLGRLTRPVLWRSAATLDIQEPDSNYVPPLVGRVSAETSRPRVPAEIMEQALAGLRHQRRQPKAESFRLAKARVVDGFERDYIRHALLRHGGNVAQAARACAKHRRAFWALMRKHGIDATPYRLAAQAAAASDD